MKRKQNKKIEREEFGETRRSGNIEEKIILIFDIFLKQSKNKKKTHGY